MDHYEETFNKDTFQQTIQAIHFNGTFHVKSAMLKVQSEFRGRRLQFSRHCQRRDDECVSRLLLWQRSHGQRQRGRQKLNYVDSLISDTGLQIEEPQRAVLDRAAWRTTK